MESTKTAPQLAPPNGGDTIERLRQQRDQINARIAKLAAQRQAQDRRDDTRRKIIAGAILLDAVFRDRNSEKPTGIAKWWDAQVLKLSRQHDRRLFGVEQQPRSGAERSDA